MAEITGIIEDIVYRNEDNGFTVVEVRGDEQDSLVTVVGLFPFANQGERVRLVGEWTRHKDYGQQLKMTSYISVAPSTIVGLENYLASGLIKGVGPSTASKLVQHFGLDTLDIIQFNPHRLIEVEGIGRARADLIASSFGEQKEMREVMIFLQSYDITTSFAIKIYKMYGSDTIKVIRENPYRLAEDIAGIGFKTADTIARSMGIDKDSPYRASAGTKFVLLKSASDGHTYLQRNELVLQTSRLLSVDTSLIDNAVVNLALSQGVFLEDIDDNTCVFSAPFYRAEIGAAKRLVELSMVDNHEDMKDVDDRISKFQKKNDIQLAEQQRLAVIEALQQGVVVITGGPGTGKTTTINCIIDLLRQQDLEVELAAPTGRAAKRMTEATGCEAKTIHRLLECGYADEGGDGFHKDENNPIKADALIIDEMSMVDILLFNNLLKAVLPGTRLIMVGDVDQLPSVGPGNVIGDIIESGIIRVVKLTEIFRQAQESMIIQNAHRMNNGEMPIFNRKDKDFYFDRKNDAEEILETISNLVNRRLPDYDGYHSLKDIQILVPMRKGIIGVNNINVVLQRVLNPPSPDKKEKTYRETLFRQGDKVMQIKNNYKLQWRKLNNEDGDSRGEGVFNGDMGFITDIDPEEQTLAVLFDDEKTVIYEVSQLDELELAYAISIHKSQGSEFPVIILPLAMGPPMLMTRNLIYTAVTRARELVVMVGREKVIEKMVGNNHIAKRYSNLSKRLLQVFAGNAGL